MPNSRGTPPPPAARARDPALMQPGRGATSGATGPSHPSPVPVGAGSTMPTNTVPAGAGPGTFTFGPGQGIGLRPPQSTNDTAGPSSSNPSPDLAATPQSYSLEFMR